MLPRTCHKAETAHDKAGGLPCIGRARNVVLATLILIVGVYTLYRSVQSLGVI